MRNELSSFHRLYNKNHQVVTKLASLIALNDKKAQETGDAQAKADDSLAQNLQQILPSPTATDETRNLLDRDLLDNDLERDLERDLSTLAEPTTQEPLAKRQKILIN